MYKKGISEVIAVVLLILVALAAAAIIWGIMHSVFYSATDGTNRTALSNLVEDNLVSEAGFSLEEPIPAPPVEPPSPSSESSLPPPVEVPLSNNWCNRTDINRDGAVNKNDTSALLLYYRKSCSSQSLSNRTLCENADIDQSGRVDIIDMSLLTRGMGMFNETLCLA